MSELPEDIHKRLNDLVSDAEEYFIAAERHIETEVGPAPTYPPGIEVPSTQSSGYYWERLTPELRARANHLTAEVLLVCAQLVDLTRQSSLTGEEDTEDVRDAAKVLRAALRLRAFWFREASAPQGEDGIPLGFQPASQREGAGLRPRAAARTFAEDKMTVLAVVELLEASTALSGPVRSVSPDSAARRYREGTAFIMMWMDPDNPSLTDVADTVKQVFLDFGVRASRADDFEHDGKITDRILDEIRTAEFLFADVSGARPNVYYEIGFAHALSKRVMLYRAANTPLHFDLAGYNCPEYSNLRELREKLTRRLEEVTNMAPRSGKPS